MYCHLKILYNDYKGYLDIILKLYQIQYNEYEFQSKIQIVNFVFVGKIVGRVDYKETTWLNKNKKR